MNHQKVLQLLISALPLKAVIINTPPPSTTTTIQPPNHKQEIHPQAAPDRSNNGDCCLFNGVTELNSLHYDLLIDRPVGNVLFSLSPYLFISSSLIKLLIYLGLTSNKRISVLTQFLHKDEYLKESVLNKCWKQERTRIKAWPFERVALVSSCLFSLPFFFHFPHLAGLHWLMSCHSPHAASPRFTSSLLLPSAAKRKQSSKQSTEVKNQT